MKRILVPIDAHQPERTRSAIEQAIRLHRDEPLHVELLSVQPRLSAHVAMFFDTQELQALQSRAGHDDLESAQRALDAAGVPNSGVVRVGRSAQTIVTTARQLGCCGIVFGNAAPGFADRLLGSLADQVRTMLGAWPDLQVIGGTRQTLAAPASAAAPEVPAA